MKIHEEMVENLHKRYDVVGTLASRFQISGRELECKSEELRSSSEIKRNRAFGLAFIPIVNFIATPILMVDANDDLKESDKFQERRSNRFKASEKTRDTLIPALEHFASVLKQSAGIFQEEEKQPVP